MYSFQKSNIIQVNFKFLFCYFSLWLHNYEKQNLFLKKCLMLHKTDLKNIFLRQECHPTCQCAAECVLSAPCWVSFLHKLLHFYRVACSY